jgi:hypothetical protein
MPATITYVTFEEHQALKAEVAQLRALLKAYILTQEEWLDTAAALRTTGIKARSTLVQHARASAPNKQEPSRITYCKDGVKCLYSRSSCIDYRQRKLGQPSLLS